MGEIGLLNEGNTCYMNSALQCLMHIPELQHYFSNGGIYEQQHKYFFKSRSNALKDFADQFKLLLVSLCDESDKRPIRPVSFRKILSIFKPSFATAEQQDAHECFNVILDLLSESLKMHVNINISGQVHSLNDDRKVNAFQQYKQFLLNNGYSFITSHFFGQFDGTITCKRCSKSSYRYDPYSSLEVEIPQTAGSIYDCLDNYCYQELLSGDNAYHCSTCKQSTDATKLLRIWTLPTILIIQLKRFGGNSLGIRTGNFIKNNKYIHFPKQLNMTKYVTHPVAIDVNPTNNHLNNHFDNRPPIVRGLQMFDLIGIIEHSGTLQGGHYVAKCLVNGKWLLFNDGAVSGLSENQLVTPNGYVLIYRMDSHTQQLWSK